LDEWRFITPFSAYRQLYPSRRYSRSKSKVVRNRAKSFKVFFVYIKVREREKREGRKMERRGGKGKGEE